MRRDLFRSSKLVIIFLSLVALFVIAATSSAPRNDYSPALRRYPYLTDVVASYATINWATDRSETSGLLRFGKVGAEACTAHSVIPTRTPISVNGVPEYQWKAQLNLEPGSQYCYRVYLGTSPTAQIDLLGSDPAPSFWTQVPAGDNDSFSFVVFGDWGYVGSSGRNPSQANLMSLIASSGARFALTTGDNGYPDGNQKNFGDLVQTGQDVSAVFGPSFWKVPGASLPIFPAVGNHGFSSLDTNHPYLLTFPQERAAATSHGRYAKENYCCTNGTTSGDYPSAWYAFDAGPARFYVLEAAWTEGNVGSTNPYKVDYDYHWAPGTDQYEWLKNDLAGHPSVLKFAFFHYPLYSDNPQESASPYLLGSGSLEGLLKQYGVDIAFTGHAHIYERNLPSASGIPNYITGGGGATIGTLGTCTALDAYAIKFTTTGAACGSAPVPTSAAQVYHFLKVTVNGTNVRVTPINSLGQAFDVIDYSFPADAETTPPSKPSGLAASAASGTQIDLSWSASTDDTKVRGYGIYRDGVLVDIVGKTILTYTDQNLSPSTTYVYQVDAFDGSGNHSGLSAAKSVTTPSTAGYTFAPVADTFVAGDLPTLNYGTSAFLKADAAPNFHSYLRFQLEDIKGTVTRATLRLYTTSSSSIGYQIKRVNDQSWEEGRTTYNNAPAVGATIASSGDFPAGSWTTVNVTSLITGNGVYDLALTSSSTATLNFNSRDASSNPPQLIVETTTVPIDLGVTVSIAGDQEGDHSLQAGQALQVNYPGVNGGPVQMASATANPIIGSEAVTYVSNGVSVSFAEMMGLPNSQLDTTYWLPWYNNVDLDTQLRFANVGGASATVRVYIGGKEMQGSPFNLAAGASTRKSFAGVNKGPVKIVSNHGVPIVVAERVLYKVNGAPTSFSEMMALPNAQLSKIYWLPWYNNVDLDTQLRIANVSGFTATVHVYIGGAEMTGSPFTLAGGASIRRSFGGVNEGPVKIVSNQNIVAAERVIYKVNGAPTSFSETMGLPDQQLDTTYWLPWYNNVSLNTQLRFANVSASTATVRVYIGGVEMPGSPFTLPAGASTRKSFPGINKGPVRIVSNVNIVAAERVIQKVSSTPTSFSEMIGLPAGQLDTIYWLPWYNNVDLASQLRFAMP